jgi:hypothetical protein
MTNHTCLFSEPLLRRYILHSKLSKVYVLYLSYWIAVIVPPVVLIIALPQEPQPVLKLAQPKISYTGNYFISVNGVESFSASPSAAITVSLDPVDINGDGTNDFFSLTLSGINTVPIFLALELEDGNGRIGIARLNLANSLTTNRMYAKYSLNVDYARNTSTTAYNLQSALAQPGQNGLRKVASIQSAFDLTELGFGKIGETVPTSNSFIADISIFIPPSIVESGTSRRDLVRLNILYFLVYLFTSYKSLTWLVGLLIRSGVIKIRMICDVDTHTKNL